MSGAADAQGFGVPFAEAIEFFRQKLRLPTRGWTDIREGMHSRAFVVAGATSDALLADFQRSILQAMEKGLTLEDFRASFDRIVARHGWAHRGSAGWRARVIFQTNLRTASAAGRWAQIQRVKAQRPYLRYMAIMDRRTRPEHAAWHDTVLHVDDPFWRTHFPPNGWNCRCQVQSLSERDLKRRGLTVSPSPPVHMEPKVVHGADGPMVWETPHGIDAGFGYNPGVAAGAGPARTPAERAGGWEPLFPAGAPDSKALPAMKPVDLGVETAPRAATHDEMRAELRRVLGGEEKIFVDPVGAHVVVGADLAQHMTESDHRSGRERYFPFIPALIETPAEIWISFARSEEKGRVWVRRRYAKLITVGKSKSLMMVTDFDNGRFTALTFFNSAGGRVLNSPQMRGGMLVYRDLNQIV